MEKKTIGSFIAALRKAKGLTQRELAEMLNVSDKAVSRWERDECYPDLTMIPVLAEIFGVSCDELLCGGRINQEERQPRQEQKTEKQLGYLAERVRTEFTVTSIWIYALTALGFIAALICNIGFNRAYVGFFSACIFYAAGLVWLAVKLTRSFSALKYEADLPLIDRAKEKIIRTAAANCVVTLIVFAATLPLTMVYSTAWGLAADSWAEYGLPAAAIAAVIGLLGSAIVMRVCAKRGVYAADEHGAATDMLRLRYTAMCAAVLAVTFAAQLYVDSDTLIFADSMSFDSIDDYVEFMETPMEAATAPVEGASAPDAELVNDSSDDYLQWRERHTETIEAPDGTVLRTFLRRNENVCRTRITWVENEFESVNVVTLDQLYAAQRRQQQADTRFMIFYVGEAVLFIVAYALAKRKI